MSSSIEKMNYEEQDQIRSTKGMKEMLKQDARMFICEEHVTLWITPQKRKTGIK